MAQPFTTPTYEIEVTDADLTGCEVLVTLQQGTHTLELSGDDLEWVRFEPGLRISVVAFTLTQEQSAGFLADSDIDIQVNIMDPAGYRAASDVDTKPLLSRQLHREVMERG